ncbi:MULTISPECIES: malonyl-ACP O-methyltransferase BioC [Nitrincola]|uniref:Malonyl-[acyl-carrier protein] O-methyltransferase n=1 Tax=Nitrincola nitratireducens TaxID=1229521 RepID=W9V682_9GAMM|nr:MULTISPECIES: malonyl-ACP O-methyltransferase BioC [Nitrincola]EXJ11632.1 Malonyl-CoA O-methyltransferase BioC [Nitrincola nitratireducens]
MIAGYADEKRKIAAQFSRAAKEYDSVASFQREVADYLLSTRVNSAQAANEVWLDLGVGTGYALPCLRQLNPRGVLIALDIAEGMLAQASGRCDRLAVSRVCGDAEHLPFAADTVHHIFSSLAVQWCFDPSQLFKELHRVLKVGGRATLATLTESSLFELKQAWRSIDNDVHVNRFLSHGDILKYVQPYFSVDSEEKSYPLSYPDVMSLMRDLKKIGANHVIGKASSGLSKRYSARQLMKAYEPFSEGGGVIATYDVCFLDLVKVSE